MDDAVDLLNLRAIEISTRSALGDDPEPEFARRVRERAGALLDDVRRRDPSDGVRRELYAVETRLFGGADERSDTGP
jgi:hypothetical protein